MQVRDAGEEAWLGKEAPEDPDLDIPEDEAPLLMLPAATSQQTPSSALKERPAHEEDNPKNPLGFGELAPSKADYSSKRSIFAADVCFYACQQHSR